VIDTCPACSAPTRDPQFHQQLHDAEHEITPLSDRLTLTQKCVLLLAVAYDCQLTPEETQAKFAVLQPRIARDPDFCSTHNATQSNQGTLG
jgi:hypothetical protein